MRKMRVPLIIIALIFILKGMSLAQKIVPWDQADKYYGQKVTVEGTIQSTAFSRTGKVCFLNFGYGSQSGLTVVIFSDVRSKFPINPADFYDGKKVWVTGVVQEGEDNPQIILNDPSQIEIIK